MPIDSTGMNYDEAGNATDYSKGFLPSFQREAEVFGALVRGCSALRRSLVGRDVVYRVVLVVGVLLCVWLSLAAVPHGLGPALLELFERDGDVEARLRDEGARELAPGMVLMASGVGHERLAPLGAEQDQIFDRDDLHALPIGAGGAGAQAAETREIPADTKLANVALRAAGLPRVEVIGDAGGVGYLEGAIHSAFHAAVRI